MAVPFTMHVTPRKALVQDSFGSKNNIMKKAIILQHGGGELANQLWNHISIYAYCLEKKIPCENYSFFEYAHYFNLPIKNKFIDLIFFKLFRGHTGRRDSLRTRLFRNLYKIYILIIRKVKRGAIISSKNKTNIPFYLPPSQKNDLEDSEPTLPEVVYFDGWLFRNPEGIVTYRETIVRDFAPIRSIQDKVAETLAPLRQQSKNIIGVHFRQGDYASFKGGRYLLSTERIHEVLLEYLRESGKNIDDTTFLIASDGKIQEETFTGCNIFLLEGSAIEDLFTLAKTDTIIGSDSSFGNLAAYLGNIPHIVITKEPVDWSYYHGRTNYFPTKYCTMVQY